MSNTPNDAFKLTEWLLFAHSEGMGQVSAGVWPLRQNPRFGTAPFGARW